MSNLKKIKKKWKRVADNKMKYYGDTDYEKKRIRVNKKKAKKGVKGELLDTIVHEEMHKRHPKMKERTVIKNTRRKIKKLSKKRKQKFYGKYK